MDKLITVLVIFLVGILGTALYMNGNDKAEIQDTIQELRTEKIALGVDPVVKGKVDEEKKTKLKSLYRKYEDLEKDVDDMFSKEKGVYMTKITSDKEEIRTALSK